MVPSGKIYKGVAAVKHTILTIPYTGTVVFKGTAITKKISGTYEGVDFYSLS